MGTVIHRLFSQAPDLQGVLTGMAAPEVNLCRQRNMAAFFLSLEGRRPVQRFLRLEEVFHQACRRESKA